MSDTPTPGDVAPASAPVEAPSAPVAATSSPAKRPPLKGNPIDYDGRAGKIFGMMIVNFLLSIVTLGIYSFWGKTRLRRYLVSSVLVSKEDRLQYTGTPLELLFGWLKAVACILPLALVLGWAAETEHYVVYFVFLMGFYALFYLGTYLALRYRFTRTKWRSIRFGLQGKSVEYMKISLIRGVLNVVTLGYLIPASDIKKWDYIANNMNFGKKMFSYKGTPDSLIVTNLVTLWAPLLPILLMLISSWSDLMEFRAYGEAAKTNPNLPPPEGMDTVLQLIFMFYGLLFLGFLGRLWYRALLRAERLRGLKLGNLRFRSTATGMGYFKLKAGNVLLMIVTLGWGFAIVKNRNMRFEATTIIVGGDLDQLIAEQSDPNTKSDIGDALAPDLDLGAAVSIGI